MAAMREPARGRLLVATPDLDDPNFDGTVILLLEHDDAGSLGVVLNRRSDLALVEAMTPTTPPWDVLATHPPVVFVGGPVSPNAVIALARASAVVVPDRWQAVLADVGVVDLGEGPVPAIGQLQDLRVFAGYAGWGEGQLAGEIAQGAWFVVDARAEDCFDADPEALWRRVLRRQGGMFTTVTDNPVLN